MSIEDDDDSKEYFKGRYGKIRNCVMAQIESIPESRIKNKKETG